MNDDGNEVVEGKVRVQSVLNKKFTQEATTSSHQVIADEPYPFGGDDLGMSPYDLLLSALGSCKSMTMMAYSRKKNWPLEKVDVYLLHNRTHAQDCEECEKESTKIDLIEIQVQMKGPLNEEQKESLLKIADKCPVQKTLQSDIQFKTTLI